MLKVRGRFTVELRLPRFILFTGRSGGAAHEGGGCDQDIPSLTSLSVAGCGRLQLGVPHLATSVALLKVVYN